MIYASYLDLTQKNHRLPRNCPCSLRRTVFQNRNFSATCTKRPDCEVWIFPKSWEFKSFTGKPKFAWLKRLKNSPRNCKLFDSVKRKLLSTERSHCCRPGPCAIFLPAFPN